MTKIKAISLKQPWANMVASGEKTIETRKWRTNYLGEILIVSSKRPKIEPAGFALAVANIVECRPMEKKDESGARIKIYPGANAWLLAGVRKIKPFPVKGSLGIFEVEVRKIEFLEQKSKREPALLLQPEKTK